MRLTNNEILAPIVPTPQTTTENYLESSFGSKSFSSQRDNNGIGGGVVGGSVMEKLDLSRTQPR